MQRPNERELLESVLESIPDLPSGFAESLLELAGKESDDRAEEIRRLIEESTRE